MLPPKDVTQLLLDYSAGDKAAIDALLPYLYSELRKLAASQLKFENPGHTLQPTALVHEAYLRLADQTRVEWRNRAHFFAIAAQVMRNILVDHARRHRAAKRGAGGKKLSLDDVDVAIGRPAEIVDLDDALKELAQFDERKARAVEMRYFGGLSIEEIGEVLGISVATVGRELRLAQAWLLRQMTSTAGA
jgi:RNA polymerase sigma factor (TIGR02999 family)